MDDIIKIAAVVFSLLVMYYFSRKMVKIKQFSFLSERQGRFASIDGLRGYLATLVFFHHFIF